MGGTNIFMEKLTDIKHCMLSVRELKKKGIYFATSYSCSITTP